LLLLVWRFLNHKGTKRTKVFVAFGSLSLYGSKKQKRYKDLFLYKKTRSFNIVVEINLLK
jgi:hypothetical protein